MTLIRKWNAPAPADTGNNIDEFIRLLARPACLFLPGADTSRNRVLVTLLHGNEPSGLKALHRLIRQGFTPAVNTYCYVIATEAALLPPLFTHRQVPGKRDFNRCFLEPFDKDSQGKVCRCLLEEIDLLQPEAVVDMHNTSGEGPSFAVTRMFDKKHEQIVSLFTDRLVITDLRLGSIMETGSHEVPVVTIECGGAFENTSDHIAYEGLSRYLGWHNLFAERGEEWGPEILSNPVRVEVAGRAALAYDEAACAAADLTLKVDIEHHNFTLVPEHTFLGWVKEEERATIQAFDPHRQDHFDTFYYCRDGKLYTKTAQKMFMITTDAAIATSDCLWYAVRV